MVNLYCIATLRHTGLGIPETAALEHFECQLHGESLMSGTGAIQRRFESFAILGPFIPGL